MERAIRLSALALGALFVSQAQEPPAKPDKEVRTEVKRDRDRTEVRVFQGDEQKTLVVVDSEGRTSIRKGKEDEDWHGWHWRPHFSGHVNILGPVQDLRTRGDGRTGYGFGLQTGHRPWRYYAHRTRLEWNVFPASSPTAGRAQTQVDQLLWSFDHLFPFNEGKRPVYLMLGWGPTRWFVEEKGTAAPHRFHTTKLALCAGLGWSFHPNLGVEARYNVSNIDRTFDASSTSLSLNWRF